jgi:hypothetical protein
MIQTMYIMGNSSASCISSGGRISERVSVYACTAKPTLERRVEGHGAKAHNCVAHIGQDVNWRMGVQETVADALEAQVREHQVCDSVHELSAVVRDVVILPTVSLFLDTTWNQSIAHLFTPVDGRGVLSPEAVPGLSVGYLEHGGGCDVYDTLKCNSASQPSSSNTPYSSDSFESREV